VAEAYQWLYTSFAFLAPGYWLAAYVLGLVFILETHIWMRLGRWFPRKRGLRGALVNVWRVILVILPYVNLLTLLVMLLDFWRGYRYAQRMLKMVTRGPARGTLEE